MAKYLFVLTRGLEDPTRMVRCLQLAKVAKEKGHEVTLFLTDDAVFLAKPGIADQITAPTGDGASPYFGFLLQQSVPIHVCTPCARNRQVEERDLVENAFFSTAPNLIDLSEGAQVFTF
jgi:predicted peroxiredoxin